MNQCKKQTTVAVIMKDKKFISIGFNEIKAEIKECPRKGMKSGEGYEFCKNICKQEYHAEVAACLKAGSAAKGATLYLIGHTYCCENCLKAMDFHGIEKVIICDTGEIIKMNYEKVPSYSF